MRQQNRKPVKFWVNDYLLAISLFALILSGGFILWFFTCKYTMPAAEPQLTKWRQLVWMLGLPYIGAVITLWTMGYDAFGRVTITEDRFILRTLFRPTIVICLDEIKDIQIDYNMLTIDKQYWVVIGKAPIPMKYMHKINAMRPSKDRIKLQYSPQLDAVLKQLFTGKLAKEYSRAKSTLYANGYQDEPKRWIR